MARFDVYNGFFFIGKHRKEYLNYTKFIPKTYESLEDDGLYPESGKKFDQTDSHGNIMSDQPAKIEGWWRYIDQSDEEDERYTQNSDYQMYLKYKNDIVIEKRIIYKGKVESITKYDDDGKYMSSEHPNED